MSTRVCHPTRPKRRHDVGSRMSFELPLNLQQCRKHVFKNNFCPNILLHLLEGFHLCAAGVMQY